ncbi:unnamed protein product [Laminaria digitata]
MLLAGSPLTGDDWAPSPGLGVVWSVLRRASVALTWGFGRALIPDSDPPARADESHAARGVALNPRRFGATPPSGTGAVPPFDWSAVRFGTTVQPALAMVGAVFALASWPDRACVVAPAICIVSLTLPSIWKHLEIFSSEGTGNDGAAML